MQLLSDGVISLRALESGDVDILYRWENDTELWEVGLTIAPFSRQQLADYIENYDGNIFTARQLRLMVSLDSTREAIGTVDLYDYDPVNCRSAIGMLGADMVRRHCGLWSDIVAPASGCTSFIAWFPKTMLRVGRFFPR